VNRKQWLRGLAVSLSVTGIHTLSFGQSYIPPGSGLAPSSYPIPSYPAYPSGYSTQSYVGNNFPYLAQSTPAPAPNTGHNHIHVPQGNYTASGGQPGSIPSVSGSQLQAQPSHTAPLPPVEHSSPVQNSPAAQVYQVPSQNQTAPQPVPLSQPLYQNSPTTTGDSSCQSCNQPTSNVWSGYAGAVNSAMSCGGSSCSSGISTGYAGGVTSPKPWIFGGNALIFDRIDNDYTRFTSLASPPTPTFPSNNATLSTFDARMDRTGGFELFGGRYFGCGKYALIGSYWGLFPGEQTRIVLDTDQTVGTDYLITDLPFTVAGPVGGNVHGIEMAGGNNFYDIYTNAYAHRLVRSQDFNNVEFNLFSFGLGGAARQGVAGCGTGHSLGSALGGWTNGRIGRGSMGQHGIPCSPCGVETSCSSASDCGSCNTASVAGCAGPCAPIIGAQCSPLRFTWLGGLRWFRFGDYMEYASSQNDGVFGGADDYYYRNTVRNDLVGGQLGGRLTYCTGRRVNVYGGTKFGVFGNRVTYDTFAGSSTTAAVVTSNNSYDGQEYNFQESTTGLALLGEGEFGLGVRLSSCWTANAGYRVVGVSGISTAPGQIPRDFSFLNDVRRINHDDSLILHGVSLGAMYNW
jgi:hypothetical protein